ncbi:MAG: NAD(+) diphosphatase [Saccharospirillaceae bacterium]|nr:NAD(+) diphosphatase [Pseudomonadales bacterium]NRB81494.1 NAD(+) diphosphatase [Saccharospirillaceae bacterium]
MLYEFGEHQFEIKPLQKKIPDETRWIVFYQGELFAKQPRWEASSSIKDSKNALYVGHLNGHPYYVVELKQNDSHPQSIDMRDVLHQSESAFLMVSRAKQLLQWRKDTKFCGACGKKNTIIDWEYATHCYDCNVRNYPRISPCMIVLVIKGDQLLLAKNKNSKHNFYSTLAGFIEVGESAELAVKREVKEEVGLEVKNITYLNSQSWPFPNQLMLGFVAEYESGEIDIDKHELLDAKWFNTNNLPVMPPAYTIARWLIDQFVKLKEK